MANAVAAVLVVPHRLKLNIKSCGGDLAENVCARVNKVKKINKTLEMQIEGCPLRKE